MSFVPVEYEIGLACTTPGVLLYAPDSMTVLYWPWRLSMSAIAELLAASDSLDCGVPTGQRIIDSGVLSLLLLCPTTRA